MYGKLSADVRGIFVRCGVQLVDAICVLGYSFRYLAASRMVA